MSHYSYFNRHVMNPIKRYGYVGDGRRAMLTLKHEVLDRIMLRRTKEERAADLKLPPLEVPFVVFQNDTKFFVKHLYHLSLFINSFCVKVKVVKLTLSEPERDFYESIYKMTRARFDTYGLSIQSH